MDIPSPDSAPAALADLIAAGLVSHEMIGDPGRLGGEAEALRTLCGLVSGSVWRIEPFHYAFRVGPGDLGGAVDGAGVDAQASALEGALQAALGADAVWVNAADLVPAARIAGPGSAPDAAGPLPDAPLLLLHAGDEARRAALEVAGPDTQAVIGARFAARRGPARRRRSAHGAARTRRAAGGDRGPPGGDPRRARGRRGAGRARAERTGGRARPARRGGHRPRRAHRRAAARAETMAGARATGRAARRRSGRPAAELAAFRETVGLALAEFLAELERRGAAPMPLRVPQFS